MCQPNLHQKMEQSGLQPTDSRHIRADMVHQLAVRERRARARGEPQRATVDGGDEPAAEEDAGGGAAVEEMVRARAGEELQEEEPDREPDTAPDARGTLPRAVPRVRVAGEVDDSLWGEEGRIDVSMANISVYGERSERTLTMRGLVTCAESAMTLRMPPDQNHQKTLVLSAMVRLGLRRALSRHFCSRSSYPPRRRHHTRRCTPGTISRLARRALYASAFARRASYEARILSAMSAEERESWRVYRSEGSSGRT